MLKVLKLNFDIEYGIKVDNNFDTENFLLK